MATLLTKPDIGTAWILSAGVSPTVFESFADDPIAAHSPRFPLGRGAGPAGPSAPSDAEIRPWGLSGMHPARHQGNPLLGVFTYNHADQIARDQTGQPMTMVEPTANKVTNNDGDEGPSEDFTYDYCPDSPFPAA